MYWINKTMASMFIDGQESFYIGLSSIVPSADGSGVAEPVGGGYNRIALDCLDGPVNGVVYNTSALSFGKADEDWFGSNNRAVCWVVFDGNSPASHVICAGLFSSPVAIRAGVTTTIPAGQVRISMMGICTT